MKFNKILMNFCWNWISLHFVTIFKVEKIVKSLATQQTSVRHWETGVTLGQVIIPRNFKQSIHLR